ncbi:MAG TPA: hypothetical protein DCY35_05795 [Prolixibacteraceae bacterium]|nr:hypothetical protein [Prolixibacteraceae bacterium]
MIINDSIWRNFYINFAIQLTHYILKIPFNFASHEIHLFMNSSSERHGRMGEDGNEKDVLFMKKSLFCMLK